jgi:hypothetical protein
MPSIKASALAAIILAAVPAIATAQNAPGGFRKRRPATSGGGLAVSNLKRLGRQV